MTQKNLKEVMERLYTEDMESYDKLWESMKTLWNLGLIDDGLHKTMIAKDHELFEKVNK